MEKVRIGGGHIRPPHLVTIAVRTPLNCVAPLRMIEQGCDACCDRSRIAEIAEQAPVVREDFFCIQIGCRDNGFATTERIGERTTHGLVGIEIRRKVDIAGGQIRYQVLEGQIAVDKVDTVLQTACRDESAKGLAI